MNESQNHLNELMNKLTGRKRLQAWSDATAYPLSVVLSHFYKLIDAIDSGSDTKNSFVLYAVRNNPNKKQCELFKARFIQVNSFSFFKRF